MVSIGGGNGGGERRAKKIGKKKNPKGRERGVYDIGGPKHATTSKLNGGKEKQNYTAVTRLLINWGKGHVSRWGKFRRCHWGNCGGKSKNKKKAVVRVTHQPVTGGVKNEEARIHNTGGIFGRELTPGRLKGCLLRIMLDQYPKVMGDAQSLMVKTVGGKKKPPLSTGTSAGRLSPLANCEDKVSQERRPTWTSQVTGNGFGSGHGQNSKKKEGRKISQFGSIGTFTER